jgi:hypothetical protein
VDALASKAVGDYVNDHFATAYQKVGTFRVVNGRKQGGNVASYFCTPDGTVVHAVAGPVDADAFLREARFAVEAHKLAATDARGEPARYQQAVRKAHTQRLRDEYRVTLPPRGVPDLEADTPVQADLLRRPPVSRLGRQAQVVALLSASPLPRVESLYPVVWEHVLGEKLSAAPVLGK